MFGWSPADHNVQFLASRIDWEGATVNATDYPDSLVFADGVCGTNDLWAEFDLSREWSALEVAIGLGDESQSGETVSFEIIGDEERLARSSAALGESETLVIDVEDVLRIRFSADGPSSCQDIQAVWGDPVLYR